MEIVEFGTRQGSSQVAHRKSGRSKSLEQSRRSQTCKSEKNELEKKLNPWFTIQQDILDFPDLVDLTLDEKGENGVGELSSEYNRLQEKFEELELLGALKNPEDLKPAFLNIHPGAGGTESQDWAEMLLRMYTRYFEKKGISIL